MVCLLFMAVTPLQQAYQLHISLNDIEPMIWRRILVPSDITLDILHLSIQDAMGWQDEHLHLFIDGNKQYGSHDPDWDEFGAEYGDECEVQLRQVLSRPNKTLLYEYDFGDSWQHTIKLEEIKSVEEVEDSPFCLGGERACPPENCGGIPGYYHLLAVMADPNHKEYEDMSLWFGGVFDPDAISLDEINTIPEDSYLDEEDDYRVIMSPLSQLYEVDGKSVQIDIYTGSDEYDWTIEIVDQYNNSTVWNEVFPTEQKALDEAIATIKEDGILAFIGNPS